MRIKNSIWESVVYESPCVGVENGGLLGGRDGVIFTYVFDPGVEEANAHDIYTPDTKFLNATIQRWQNHGIELCGIFHTHLSGNERLSKGDIRYIERVMERRAESAGSLYFPVIFPKEKMIVYRADKDGDKVRIVSEGIELL